MTVKLTKTQKDFLKRHNARQTLNRYAAEVDIPFIDEMLATGMIEVVETRSLLWFSATGEPLPEQDRQWAGTKLTDAGESLLLSEGYQFNQADVSTEEILAKASAASA